MGPIFIDGNFTRTLYLDLLETISYAITKEFGAENTDQLENSVIFQQDYAPITSGPVY